MLVVEAGEQLRSELSALIDWKGQQLVAQGDRSRVHGVKLVRRSLRVDTSRMHPDGSQRGLRPRKPPLRAARGPSPQESADRHRSTRRWRSDRGVTARHGPAQPETEFPSNRSSSIGWAAVRVRAVLGRYGCLLGGVDVRGPKVPRSHTGRCAAPKAAATLPQLTTEVFPINSISSRLLGTVYQGSPMRSLPGSSLNRRMM